jgi:CheY-like chemotaxis protein
MTAGSRVLAVEDDPALGYALKVKLERAAFSVRLAASSMEALDYLEQADRPDLLITDIRFGPGQPHGFSLARMARYRHPKLRCIFITGDDVPVEEERSAMGPILHKPVELDDLLRVVHAELMEAQSTGI